VIAGPILLLVIPLAMAGIVYLVLRWETLAALLAIGTAMALGFAIILLPLDQPVHVWGGQQIALGETVSFFGRELILDPSDRVAMALFFFTSAILFALAWRIAPRSLFLPVGLGLLSLLSGALLIRPLIYAALLLVIAAALSVFALQPAEGRPTRGGMRYLTFATLALPGLLVTHWLMDRYALTPDDTSLLGISAVLLTISFASLLGVVPFHTWVPAIFSDGVPLAGAFVLTVGNGAVWFLLLDFLEMYSWLSAHPEFDSLILMAGTGLVIVGGLLAPAQRRVGSLVGYAALVDTGAMLIALGLNSKVGLTLLFLALLVRPVGVALMAVGLSGLRTCCGDDDRWDGMRGVGWQMPWSTTALLFGGLSVAGFPVSAGFVWRWSLYRTLVSSHPGTAVCLLLASIAVLGGVWHGLFVLLERPHSQKNRSVIPLVTTEGWVKGGVILVVVLICIGLGLFPQLVAPWASRLTDGYTFFVP